MRPLGERDDAVVRRGQQRQGVEGEADERERVAPRAAPPERREQAREAQRQLGLQGGGAGARAAGVLARGLGAQGAHVALERRGEGAAEERQERRGGWGGRRGGRCLRGSIAAAVVCALSRCFVRRPCFLALPPLAARQQRRLGQPRRAEALQPRGRPHRVARRAAQLGAAAVVAARVGGRARQQRQVPLGLLQAPPPALLAQLPLLVDGGGGRRGGGGGAGGAEPAAAVADAAAAAASGEARAQRVLERGRRRCRCRCCRRRRRRCCCCWRWRGGACFRCCCGRCRHRRREIRGRAVAPCDRRRQAPERRVRRQAPGGGGGGCCCGAAAAAAKVGPVRVRGRQAHGRRAAAQHRRLEPLQHGRGKGADGGVEGRVVVVRGIGAGRQQDEGAVAVVVAAAAADPRCVLRVGDEAARHERLGKRPARGLKLGAQLLDAPGSAERARPVRDAEHRRDAPRRVEVAEARAAARRVARRLEQAQAQRGGRALPRHVGEGRLLRLAVVPADGGERDLLFVVGAVVVSVRCFVRERATIARSIDGARRLTRRRDVAAATALLWHAWACDDATLCHAAARPLHDHQPHSHACACAARARTRPAPLSGRAPPASARRGRRTR